MKKITNETEEKREKTYKTVNLDYLHEVSNGNKKFIRDMIKLFLAEVPEELNTLERTIHEKDFDGIRESAHKLKSSIPFVGLDRIIRNELSEIERLGAEGENQERIVSLFSKVKQTCGDAIAELQEQHPE
jgi:HPt (histidine-containing phosphotransfer) domain-containing protein